MIEAVNSVIANASLLRGNTEQSSTARSFAANPERVQETTASGPQAPFVSPFIYVDVNHNKAVLQIRDSDTGDVVRQFPSESRLEAQRREQAGAEGRTAQPRESTSFVGVQDSAQSTGGVDVAQAAVAAFSAGAQAGQSSSGDVSVLA